MRYLVRNTWQKRAGKTGNKLCFGFFVESSNNEVGACMVTMHDGDGVETCLVPQAAFPMQRACRSFLEALSKVSDVHEADVDAHEGGCRDRAKSGPKSRTLGETGANCGRPGSMRSSGRTCAQFRGGAGKLSE